MFYNKMNLICNNCIGARIYQLNNEQYKNPFMWNLISVDNFIMLIKKFNKIDFNNVECTLSDNYARIVIDNKITVNYIHYKFDEQSFEPKTTKSSNGVDVLYNKIVDYAIQKYKDRLALMVEKPTFLFSFNYERKPNIDEYCKNVETLIKLSKKHKICLVVHTNIYEMYKEKQNKNFIMVTSDIDTLRKADITLWEMIYDKLKEQHFII